MCCTFPQRELWERNRYVYIDWVIPNGDMLDSITAMPGDTLVFIWEGNDNVFLMTGEDAFDRCSFQGATFQSDGNLERGPEFWVQYTIPRFVQGPLYFGCGVGGHCFAGQKIRIDLD